MFAVGLCDFHDRRAVADLLRDGRNVLAKQHARGRAYPRTISADTLNAQVDAARKRPQHITIVSFGRLVSAAFGILDSGMWT